MILQRSGHDLQDGNRIDRMNAESRRYRSFSEFWPFYVSEHSKPATRLLHLVGTTAGIALMVYLIATGRWWLFFLGFVPGYGFAWLAHFVVEKNTPATFKYPLWSFMGDYKMIALMLTGRMRSEVERLAR